MLKQNINKSTKIVCTIGPASDTKEMIEKMVEAGMNCMRLNFSHGTYDEHLAKMQKARDLQKNGIYIPIMLDSKGPEIRTHLMENNVIPANKGDIFHISMKEVLGIPPRNGKPGLISVSFAGLYDDVKVGDHIKYDDGKLDMVVTGKDEKDKEIICECLDSHDLSSRKGVNCVGSRLSMPFLSKKDEQDLIWGCEHDIDFVSASFVRNPQDVRDIRKVLSEHGHPEIKIISKIENVMALQCIDQIVDESDGIMVARGDLGVEIPPEEVPVIQEQLIKRCRLEGKPVITATQMLDSMTHSPVPTRAEVSDVATAITQSSDCVMLSAESASGEYPVESVEMQARIAHTMEPHLNFEQLAKDAYDSSEKNNNDAIANSIANTAKLINARLIVSFTETGNSSRRISKARPCCPILSISNNIKTVLQNGLYWGIYSQYIPTKMPDFIEEMEVLAIVYAKGLGLKPGDQILISGGTPTGAGKTNFMRIIQLPKDRDVL